MHVILILGHLWYIQMSFFPQWRKNTQQTAGLFKNKIWLLNIKYDCELFSNPHMVKHHNYNQKKT